MTAAELIEQLPYAADDKRPVVVVVQYVDESVTYNIVDIERYEDAIVVRVKPR